MQGARREEATASLAPRLCCALQSFAQQCPSIASAASRDACLPAPGTAQVPPIQRASPAFLPRRSCCTTTRSQKVRCSFGGKQGCEAWRGAQSAVQPYMPCMPCCYLCLAARLFGWGPCRAVLGAEPPAGLCPCVPPSPPTESHWPGLANVFSVACILGSALVFFMSRSPGEEGGGVGYGAF